VRIARFVVPALLLLVAPAASLVAQQRVLASEAVLSLPLDPARVIAAGETKRAALAAGDDMLSDSSHFGRWHFEGKRGQRVTVTQRSAGFDTFLQLGKQGASEIAEQNDDAEETNSEITYTLPEDGLYVIIAGSFAPRETGDYTVTLAVRDPLPGMTGPVTPVTLLLREADPMQRVGLDRRMGSQLDARDARMDDSTLYELWYITASAGDEIAVTLESSQFLGAVFVGRQGAQEALGGAVGAQARVTFTAATTGTYVIVVSGGKPVDVGSYVLDVARKPRTP
jgi:plastocyanin